MCFASEAAQSPDEIIVDSLVIGQPIKGGADERVVLFLQLPEGGKLSDDLVNRVKAEIRTRRSPRHVPARVRPPSTRIWIESDHLRCRFFKCTIFHTLSMERKSKSLSRRFVLVLSAAAHDCEVNLIVAHSWRWHFVTEPKHTSQPKVIRRVCYVGRALEKRSHLVVT